MEYSCWESRHLPAAGGAATWLMLAAAAQSCGEIHPHPPEAEGAAMWQTSVVKEKSCRERRCLPEAEGDSAAQNRAASRFPHSPDSAAGAGDVEEGAGTEQRYEGVGGKGFPTTPAAL